MRYAQIRKMDISNGEGIGVALFVQGCHFRCHNCFNSETWDFNSGKEWTDEIADKFLDLADKPHIKRISILGGEPLAEENRGDICHLLQKIRDRFERSKQVWLYTGYTFEEIIEGMSNTDTLSGVYMATPLMLCDVIVDGKYIDDLKDYKLKWRGSSNQRVIDVHASVRDGLKVHLWTGT